MTSRDMSRNPDMTWQDTGKTRLAFEDLSERFSFKLHSLLRYTGRFYYTLWEREVIGPDFFERTGQFAPIYSMEMQVTDEPLGMRDPLVVETTIRLGRTVDAKGSTTRIVSQAEQRLTGTGPEGRVVEVGRMRKHSIFTRPGGSSPEVPSPEVPRGARADSDKARADSREDRRVTALHECLGLGPEPPRTFTLLTVTELSVPHADFDPDPTRRAFTFADTQPHVWGYEQTDPNRHVHAMDYVKVFEPFGWDHLAEHGISAADHFYDGCRIVFRAPCFRGERYLRKARFEPREAARAGGPEPGGPERSEGRLQESKGRLQESEGRQSPRSGGLLLGQLFKAGDDGRPGDPSQPAVAIQLGVRPNGHPSTGGHDSE